MRRKKNALTDLNQAKFRATAAKLLSIEKLVQEVIDTHQLDLFEKNIIVETDLTHVEAVADSGLVKSAFTSLIGNAKALMTSGGELTVTLIDGNHQWELEVADSCESAKANLDLPPSTPNSESELPNVIPFPATEHLRNAYRAAISHGGQLQSWDCPQGGTAHVLVIPKRTTNRISQRP